MPYTLSTIIRGYALAKRRRALPSLIVPAALIPGRRAKFVPGLGIARASLSTGGALPSLSRAWSPILSIVLS